MLPFMLFLERELHQKSVMKGKLKSLAPLLSRSFSQWSDHDAQTMAAGLSYFTVLSLAPLLVVAISIAGIVFGHEAARTAVVNQLVNLTGSAGADAIKGILEHAESPKSGILASLIGFVVLIFSASGVFSQLRKALNRIWEVQPKDSSGVWGMIREQFFSYTMVVGIGFLLLVSLVISAGLTAAGKFVGAYVPTALFQGLNILVSLVVITFLFAVMYRVVPERTLPWNRLWVGSFATAALFTIGKYLLGLYLGHASIGSAYGAAGSLVVLLVWIYYSSCLFLLGAEFTRIYACEQQGACLNMQPQEGKAKQQATEREVQSRKGEGTGSVPAGSVGGRNAGRLSQGKSDHSRPVRALVIAAAWVTLSSMFRRLYGHRKE